MKAATEVVWPLSDVPTSAVEAVQTNMALIGSILTSERLHRETFKNFWGAGIETIYWDGNRFTNLGQVSFVFHHWFKNTVDDAGHPVPVKVTHYKYVGERLFIIDVEAPKWRKQAIDDWYVFEFEDLNPGLFVVDGIDHKSPVDWEELKEHISFMSTFVGMGYIIIEGNRVLGPGSFHGTRDASVEYRHNDYLRIEIRRAVYDQVAGVFDNSSFEGFSETS